MAKEGKKRHPVRTFLIILLIILVGVPLALAGLSFIGRIQPDSVIPDSFTVYARIPNPAGLAGRLLDHEPLGEILTEPSLAFLLPVVSELRDSGLTEKGWFQFAAKGKLDAALLEDGAFLAAWDTGVLSPLLRFLPALSGRVTVPGLYYVSAGKNSRFEFRRDGEETIFIGPYKNLLVASNNSRLFESVLQGTSRDGDLRGSDRKSFYSREHDGAILVSSERITSVLSQSDPLMEEILGQIKFPGFMELAVNLGENQINLTLTAPVSSGNPAMAGLLAKNSAPSGLTALLPESTQYSTILSLGTLEELLAAVSAVSGPGLASSLNTADRLARTAFRGLGLDELIFSWAGAELGVFGLEGRPHPVFALQVRDEQKRKEIFDRIFSSLIVNENISFVLDGTRLPQIRLPDFVSSLLKLWDISIPFPYYTVQKGFLLLSESPENLLAAVGSINRNSVLPRTGLWRDLSASGSDLSSFSLFYSLDRSLPFFLKGNTTLNSVLKVYRQGLAKLNLNNQLLTLSLSAVSGSGQGVSPISGYPLAFDRNMNNEVEGILYDRRGESRLFFSSGNTALSLNPADNRLYELEGTGPVRVVALAGGKVKNAGEPSAWVVNSQGLVTLVNGSMETVPGFPVITGVRLSAPPAGWDGALYLPDDNGSVFRVDQNGRITQLPESFHAPLRSAPDFLTAGGSTYMGVYPKSFLGEIWLLDLGAGGGACPGWPVFISGIAFGSPELFSRNGEVFAAFVTQAGELNLFDFRGVPVEGFPLELPGIFFQQPVFDGEFLWLVSSAGRLFQVSPEGDVLFQDIPNFTAEEGSITLFDADGDKIPEIFLTGSGNTLYGFSRNFISLDGFPLAAWGRPFWGDLNGDGKMELAALGMDNRLYRWQFK